MNDGMTDTSLIEGHCHADLVVGVSICLMVKNTIQSHSLEAVHISMLVINWFRAASATQTQRSNVYYLHTVRVFQGS